MIDGKRSRTRREFVCECPVVDMDAVTRLESLSLLLGLNYLISREYERESKQKMDL